MQKELLKNKEISLFYLDYLIYSPESLIVCSMVYKKYKNFCLKRGVEPMKYILFRKELCNQEENIYCVWKKSCYFFSNLTYKNYEDN